MIATIVTVTHPPNAMEMRACALTLRDRLTEHLEWIVITEEENKTEVERIVPFERVESMEYDPRLEAIKVGYCRQNAAKLQAIKLIEHDGLVIFMDDDVTCSVDWGVDTFLDDNGKPIVYYLPSENYPWMWGSIACFGRPCPRRWQLKLPMVMTAPTLREICASLPAERAMKAWADGEIGVSEFQIMGEMARKVTGNREAFRNIALAKDHWTIHRGIFHDWQCDRRKLRLAIEAGEV